MLTHPIPGVTLKMIEQMKSEVCIAVPSTDTYIKRSQCSSSTLCLVPKMKRQRFSSFTSVDLDSRLSSGALNLNSYHVSSDSPSGSSRINNIRCVSDASIKATKDDRRSMKSTGSISSMTNYFCSSNTSTRKTLTNQPILDSDLVASKIVDGSLSSSVPSLKRIFDAIEVLNCSTGTDMQSQQNISDQCCYLVAWTKINSASYADNDPRPTSTSNLTLHQVALAIVSYNGFTAVLDAMDAHPANIAIQEHGSMMLGNLLSILYRRKTYSVMSYERYLGEATIKLGNSIFKQIIDAMRNHSSNVAVHCAAITALQQYYLSVLVFQPSDAILQKQRIVLLNAEEMFLPRNIQQILRTTTCLSEQYAVNFC